MNTLKKRSNSASETKKIARELARKLGPGDVVTLSGELGAGKTTFAKGLAKGLGVRLEKEVSSPTFVIIHEYACLPAGRKAMPLYHLDWYRLEHVVGADREMAEECFSGQGVTLVEWPERGKALLPHDRYDVHLRHAGKTSRTIEIRFKK